MVAHQAHNLEVGGSSPPPATKFGSMVEWLQCRLVTPRGTGSNPVIPAIISRMECDGFSTDALGASRAVRFRRSRHI